MYCGLLVNYCDVFISCLACHSDGTHSLQWIHWWGSDVMIKIYFDEETNSPTSWMSKLPANLTFWVNYSLEHHHSDEMDCFVFLQRYLDEAERDKMQYARELREYQKSEAYQITCAKVQDKRIKRGKNDLVFGLKIRNSTSVSLERIVCLFCFTEELASVIINANSSGSTGFKVSIQTKPQFLNIPSPFLK